MRIAERWTDRAAPVRPGEALDLERLGDYLAREHPALAGELTVEQFPSGYSNLTYLVGVRRDDGETREMVLRRPPFGSRVASAHDMGREYRILSALEGLYPKAPRPLFHCADAEVIGAPFYAMERRRGLILRGGSPDTAPDPEVMRRVGEAFVETLAELHAVDYEAAGLAELGRPRGYVRRQVEGWSERWRRARVDDVEPMETAAAWLNDSLSARSGFREAASLVHNDFKYDNLVLSAEDPGRVDAVLDWEMATLGDPLMDLGTALGYWTDPDDDPALLALSLSPTTWPGNPSRREIATRYLEATGSEARELVFFYVFGLFKIAVILQQIYYRYRQGLTADPRFARLDEGVEALARTAARAIETGRIDRLYAASP